MASTYTVTNALNKQAVGDNVNLWGLIVNNNFDLIDQAIDGIASITLTGSTASLTIDQGQLSNGRCAVLKFGGSLSAPCTVSLPASTGTLTKFYWVKNSSGQNVILQQALNGTPGATVTIPTGASEAVLCDGQGNVETLSSVTSAPGNFTVGGDLHVGGNIFSTGSAIVADLAVTTNASELTDGTNNFADYFNLAKFVLGLADNGPAKISGGIVMSDASQVSTANGTWVIYTFGTVVGSRFQIAFGQGNALDGDTIALPTGFTFGSPNLIGYGLSAVPWKNTQPNFPALSECSVASPPSAPVVTMKWQNSAGTTVSGNVLWSGNASRANA